MGETAETLQQLEGDVWAPPKHDSHLVGTIHALRRKPIHQFTVEDLRIALGQKMGIEFLTPLALERLEADPFAAGDFYPGDLLVSVMDLPADYWEKHPREANRMATIADHVRTAIDHRAGIDSVKDRILELLALASWRAG